MRSVSDQCRDPEVEDVPAPLAAIGEAARVLLEDDNPTVRRVGAWLLEGARGDLLEHLGAEGSRGHSIRLAAALAARNRALREAAEAMGDLAPAERVRLLSAALRRYRASAWRHDRDKPTCPHPARSPRASLWRALRAVDRDLGPRQLARILEG